MIRCGEYHQEVIFIQGVGWAAFYQPLFSMVTFKRDWIKPHNRCKGETIEMAVLVDSEVELVEILAEIEAILG